MLRFLTGLLIGAAGAWAIVTLDMRRYDLAAPLVGLAGGLVIGALVGWRNPRPGRALVAGVGLGFLAGLLMVGGQLYGAMRVGPNPPAPLWLDGAVTGGQFVWVVAGVTGGASLILAMGASGAFAGILSAWTGLSAPHVRPAGQVSASATPTRPVDPAARVNPASDERMRLLPGPGE